MTKTIEELASEYYLNDVINGDTCDDKDGWTDCFVSGAKALMQLPLTSRLTAEEKERINKAYAYAITHIEFDENRAEVRLLHHIFGKDFFKEER